MATMKILPRASPRGPTTICAKPYEMANAVTTIAALPTVTPN